MDEPAGQEHEGVYRLRVPSGTAAIEVVLDRTVIRVGERVTLRLVNLGEVELMTGPPFETERWDGTAWLTVPPQRFGDAQIAFPDVGWRLAPSEQTEPQKWPLPGMEIQPGWYQIVKAAIYEGHPYGRPDRELVARTRVQVR